VRHVVHAVDVEQSAGGVSDRGDGLDVGHRPNQVGGSGDCDEPCAWAELCFDVRHREFSGGGVEVRQANRYLCLVRGDLPGRQLLTIDFGLNQAGGQVIVRIDAPVLGERDAVVADAVCRSGEIVEFHGDVGIAEPGDHVRPVEDLLIVAFGDAHHVADHLQGKGSGNFGNELAITVGVIAHHRRDESPRPLPDRFLDVTQYFGRESPAHCATQPLMSRVVHGDHARESFGKFGCHVRHHDGWARN
jgi:hypothetical protein